MPWDEATAMAKRSPLGAWTGVWFVTSRVEKEFATTTFGVNMLTGRVWPIRAAYRKDSRTIDWPFFTRRILSGAVGAVTAYWVSTSLAEVETPVAVTGSFAIGIVTAVFSAKWERLPFVK